MARVIVLTDPSIIAPSCLLRTPLEVISGVVTDKDGNPAAREVRLYRENDFIYQMETAKVPYAITWSDPVTGEYSFTVNEGPVREWVVVCVGQEGENVLAHHHVRVGV